MTKQVELRFYAELNDFLPPRRRFVVFSHPLGVGRTVKDLIEGLGVPHTEVDLVLVNGEPVGFDHRPGDGDRIGVYPVFESFDMAAVQRLRPEPLRDPRFVIDANLGQLARYLRLLGFDTLYRRDYEDAELVRISVAERRILLTRDIEVLKRKELTHAYFVRQVDPVGQAIEVLKRFDLEGATRPLERCIECNGELLDAAKAEVEQSLPPRTAQVFDEFRRCSECGRVYWKGSHHPKLEALIRRFRGEAGSSVP